MDTISTKSLLLTLVLMLLISAFFSAAETGMMSLNRYKLRHLAKNKHKSAMRVEKLLQRPDRLLGLILIGNNLVHILASSIATLLAIRAFGDYGIAVATTLITFAILIFSVSGLVMAGLQANQHFLTPAMAPAMTPANTPTVEA